VEDRTDGTFVATGISSLYAARDMAERRNVDADPVTAADLAEDAPLMTQQVPALKVLPTPAEMATAGRFIPLTGGADPASQALMNRIRGLAFQDELRKLWTNDTRVRHQDGRTGNVIAGDTSWVQLPDHVNYGRAYTGVMWDRTPETHMDATWRGRPFTDQLTRI